MIKICTDSCVDINKDQIEDNNISVLPLSIILGDKEYLDGVDITPKEIFAYVDKTGQLPKTAARSIEDFKTFFNNLLKDGSEVIYMGISSKLSSAFNYACQAKEELQNEVETLKVEKEELLKKIEIIENKKTESENTLKNNEDDEEEKENKSKKGGKKDE